MKNWPIFVFSLISSLVAIPAWANPNLTITPIAGINSSLNLHGEGSTSLEIEKVATVQASNNLPALSYTLTISSGAMINTGGGPNVSYQIATVNSGQSPPQSSDFVVASGDDLVQCSADPLNLDLYIKYTPASLQEPGDYSSTINIVATDNSEPCT